MASFFESFAESFGPAFRSSLQAGAGVRAVNAQNKANMDFLTALNAFEQSSAQLEAANEQDATQGFEFLNSMRELMDEPDVIRKSMIQSRIEQARANGVPISKEAEKIFLGLKGDEGAAFWDELATQASSTEGFGIKMVGQVASDPAALAQAVMPVGKKVAADMKQKEAIEKGESTKTAEELALEANDRKITAEVNTLNTRISKEQQKLVALQNQLDKIAQAGIASGADQRTIGLVQDRKKREVTRQQSVIDRLQKRADSLTDQVSKNTRESLVDAREQAQQQNELGQFQRRLRAAVDKGTISPERAEELNRAQLERTAFGDEELTTINTETGEVLTAKGQQSVEAARQKSEITRKQTVKKRLNEQKGTTAAMVRLANRVVEISEAAGDQAASIQSISGAILRGFNSFTKQIGGIKNAVLSDGSRVDFKADTYLQQLDRFQGLASLSAVQKSNLVRLAYMVAKTQNDRVTDADFRNAIDQIGATSGDPVVLKFVLADVARQSVEGINDSVVLELEEESDFRSDLENKLKVDTKLLDFDVAQMNLVRGAMEAIRQGADPEAVQTRLRELGVR